MYSFKNLSKTYQSKNGPANKVLNELNFEIEDKSKVAILGPSGSGKTSLLNIIGGFDQADNDAEISIGATSTKNWKQIDWDNYRNHKVAVIFKDFKLIEHQTAIQNVEMAFAFTDLGSKTIHEHVKDALNKVGMEGKEKLYPKQLTPEQCQRVAIARAIAKNPDIILADEPTGSLNSASANEIMNLLTKLCKDKTLVIATHNEDLANKYCDTVLNIKDGVINATNATSSGVPSTASAGASAATSAAASAVASSAASNSATPANSPTQANIHPANSSKNTENVLNKSNQKRSALGLAPALQMAFSSMKNRRAKSLLMILGGCLGVFIVALVLSLSNGLNTLLNDTPHGVLSPYPIPVTQSRDVS
ncbi:MAG: ABC transporter ATP-binding protein, partial [Clostridia bacterium]|nr:ABC transporter ATP-binding protein [Clostridia bacterium]